MKEWQHKIYVIIFEHDTPAGKRFDVFLLWSILISIILVMLESVKFLHDLFDVEFAVAEWIFTAIFTVEYVLRIVTVKQPLKYITSFYGIIDLISILPTYFSLFLGDVHQLLVIRGIRLLRVFRILKLVRFTKEARLLLIALRESRIKITVFLGAVLSLVVILGTIMYLIEGGENGFTSIPRSVYWTIVTITTVGYGDIAPSTVLGQTIASMIMLIGYAIIAVPTGIVSVSYSQVHNRMSHRACENCSKEGHDKSAIHCKFCGHKLEKE